MKKRRPFDGAALESACETSDGDVALNLAGAQAASADINALGRAIHNSPDTLDVGFPCALRCDMGMADAVAVNAFLLTELTFVCHVLHLLHGVSLQSKSYFIITRGCWQVFLFINSIDLICWHTPNRCASSLPLSGRRPMIAICFPETCSYYSKDQGS